MPSRSPGLPLLLPRVLLPLTLEKEMVLESGRQTGVGGGGEHPSPTPEESTRGPRASLNGRVPNQSIAGGDGSG